MANKLRRILALAMVLTLCLGHLAVPAVAADSPQPQVDVTVELSQVPAPSETTDVRQNDPVTTTETNEETGETITTTTTETTWEGSDGDTDITGSETRTDYTAEDSVTGDPLYAGGSLEGSETSQTTTSSETSETTETQTVTDVTSTSTTNDPTEETSTSQQQPDEVVEGEGGDFEKTGETISNEKTTVTDGTASDAPLNEIPLPEEGVVIPLTPSTTEPGTFRGSVNGQTVTITDLLQLPEGAELVKDDQGNVIGYRLAVGTTVEKDVVDETITTEEGEAQGQSEPVESNPVTPEPESYSHLLTDDSQITEEVDENDPDKVIAFVITNKTENTVTGTDVTLPERPADGTETDADGNLVTITTEDVTDSDGSVIGFTFRKVVTDPAGKTLQDVTTTQIIRAGELPAPAEPVVTFTLPEKPAERDTTDADGVRTVVTVQDLVEDGKHVGYTTLTVLTDSEGVELFRESKDTYGTETTETQTVTPGETTSSGSWSLTTTVTDTYRITAEEQIFEDLKVGLQLKKVLSNMEETTAYELVEIDGRLYVIYSGEMTVTEGDNHGDTSGLNPITPQSSLMEANSGQDLSQPGSNVVHNTSSRDGFKFYGYGISSELKINMSTKVSPVTQFKLKSPGGEKTFYALCIDNDTTIQKGHLYDLQDITSVDYYQQPGSLSVSAAEMIRSVALNGYWGTASGIGSMSEVQALLIDYLKSEKNMTDANARSIADSLTAGQALSATQAALWKFGNKNPYVTVNENNLVNDRWGEDETNTRYLYNALLAKASDEDAELPDNVGAEFLDAEDVTGGSITINSKIIDPDNPDAELYDTDLSFTLGIEKAKLFGDLIVTVYVDGVEERKVRLAGDNSKLNLFCLEPENGVYTIPNVELAPGVNVTLNLSGTQDIGTGVYIYTSVSGMIHDSQTLVTLASGSRSVDLDLDMNFRVHQPTATKTEYESTRSYQLTETYERPLGEVVRTPVIVTNIEHDRSTTEEYTAQLVCATDVTITDTVVSTSREDRDWYASWRQDAAQDPAPQDGDGDIPGGGSTLPDEVVPLSSGPADPAPLTEILDEDVPLAQAPKTGDVTLLLAGLSLASLGGLALLGRKKKED